MSFVWKAPMNALRLPTFFESVGHSNVELKEVCEYQAQAAWKAWKAGELGNISLSDGIIEFAKTHKELKKAFFVFKKDADELYGSWRERLCISPPWLLQGEHPQSFRISGASCGMVSQAVHIAEQQSLRRQDSTKVRTLRAVHSPKGPRRRCAAKTETVQSPGRTGIKGLRSEAL